MFCRLICWHTTFAISSLLFRNFNLFLLKILRVVVCSKLLLSVQHQGLHALNISSEDALLCVHLRGFHWIHEHIKFGKFQ